MRAPFPFSSWGVPCSSTGPRFDRSMGLAQRQMARWPELPSAPVSTYQGQHGTELKSRNDPKAMVAGRASIISTHLTHIFLSMSISSTLNGNTRFRRHVTPTTRVHCTVMGTHVNCVSHHGGSGEPPDRETGYWPRNIAIRRSNPRNPLRSGRSIS